MLPNGHRRSSESSSSVNGHLDCTKTSKEIYSPLKFLFDEQDHESPFPAENKGVSSNERKRGKLDGSRKYKLNQMKVKRMLSPGQPKPW